MGRDDCACALQTIFLAAHALGVGSVWINQLRHVCDEAKVRDLLTAYGVPTTHKVYGCAALGYPAAEPRDKTLLAGRITYR
jgi:nitroreductase